MSLVLLRLSLFLGTCWAILLSEFSIWEFGINIEIIGRDW
jgi:hypothetical protein